MQIASIAGSASVTTVESSISTNSPVHDPTSTHQGFRAAGRLASLHSRQSVLSPRAAGRIAREVEAGKPQQRGAGNAVSVEFREATKVYPGADRPAVDKLSLEVPAGEICVLVGPSGCGKTTAMRMANRMVEITDGDILIGDRSVRERSPASCAARSAT